MIKTILLTIVFLKTSLQRMQSRYYENIKKNKKIKRILFFIVFAVLAGVIAFFSSNIINILQQAHQETTFVGVILFLVLMLTIIQAVFSSVNMLYFTKDTEYILPLPLKPYQIIVARTNVIIIVQYIIEIFVGLIPLIVYGFKMNCNSMFYLPVLISLILLPILPTVLISFVVVILMSFSKITKNKNKFQLFATFIVFALTIAFSIFMVKIDEQSISDEQIAQLMTKANGMVEVIKGYFPTLKYCTNAVLSNNILTMMVEFAKAIGITLIAYIAYALLSQKLYFKGLVGSLFSGENKNKKRKNKIKVEIKRKSIGKRYIEKEFKTLLRNPVYLIQCILPAVLFPILCIVLILISFDEIAVNEIMQALSGLNANGLILLNVIGITQFFSMIVYVSITAISRDGKNAVFMKYIPVSLYKQYIYKTIPNIIMNLFTIIIVLAVSEYILKISILDLIIVFIISMLMNIAQSFIMILVDLKRPKLQWNSEYAVVKQNLNLIFPAIFSLLSIGLLILYSKTTQIISVYIVLAMIAVIYLLITIFVNIYLYKRQNELAGKIE